MVYQYKVIQYALVSINNIWCMIPEQCGYCQESYKKSQELSQIAPIMALDYFDDYGWNIGFWYKGSCIADLEVDYEDNTKTLDSFTKFSFDVFKRFNISPETEKNIKELLTYENYIDDRENGDCYDNSIIHKLIKLLGFGDIIGISTDRYENIEGRKNIEVESLFDNSTL